MSLNNHKKIRFPFLNKNNERQTMYHNINGTPLNEAGHKAYPNGKFFQIDWLGDKYVQMASIMDPRSWNEYKAAQASKKKELNESFAEVRGGRSRRVRKTRRARKTRRSRKH